jgi:hypothetical protein
MKKNLGIEAHRKTMRRVEDLKHQARYKRPRAWFIGFVFWTTVQYEGCCWDRGGWLGFVTNMGRYMTF